MAELSYEEIPEERANKFCCFRRKQEIKKRMQSSFLDIKFLKQHASNENTTLSLSDIQ